MTINGKKFPCQDLTDIEDLYIKGKKIFLKYDREFIKKA